MKLNCSMASDPMSSLEQGKRAKKLREVFKKALDEVFRSIPLTVFHEELPSVDKVRWGTLGSR